MRLRRWAWRVGGGLLSLLALVVATGFVSLRYFVPRSPISAEPSEEVRRGEDARLAANGLKVPAGGLILAHPFSPPWTRRSLIVPAAWLRPGLAEWAAWLGIREVKVKAADLLADLDMLEPVMSLQYGGWQPAKARGFDWSRWFADWRARLRQAGEAELSLDEAFRPVDELLRFQRDNHTQIPLIRRTERGSQTLVLASLVDGACTQVETEDGRRQPLDTSDPAQRARRALAMNSRHDGLIQVDVMAMPEGDSPPRRAECNGRWVGLTLVMPRPRSLAVELAQRALSAEAPSVRRISSTAVRARLPTFVGSVYEKVEAQRLAGAHPDGGETLIIFDLRGNGGGSASLADPILGEWVGVDRLPSLRQMPVRIDRSCLLAGLNWNLGAVLDGAERPGAPSRRRSQAFLDELAWEQTRCLVQAMPAVENPWFFSRHAVRPRGHRPRIIALVDGGCGSDCEGFVHRLAALPETVLVGANTYGVGQFVVPGYSVLPHTRLTFRMAMGHSNIYGDHRSFDGYGLDVDVVLRDDAEATDERLIELAKWLDAATDAGPRP